MTFTDDFHSPFFFLFFFSSFFKKFSGFELATSFRQAALAMDFPLPVPHSEGEQEKARDLCSRNRVLHYPNNETSSVAFKTVILTSVKL